MSDRTPHDPDRRTFLKESALAASALAVGCGGTSPAGNGAASGDADLRELPGDALRALAAVILPSELGPEGLERVVAGFQSWLAAYEPVPVLVHGYGSQEIRYGPPDPAPRWRAQLEALELEARKRHDTGFAELETAQARRLVERAIRSAPDGLPDKPGALRAETIAEGLLGFFYGSPEAADLCYGRRIRHFGCRPLAASADPPAPLDGTAEG